VGLYWSVQWGETAVGGQGQHQSCDTGYRQSVAILAIRQANKGQHKLPNARKQMLIQLKNL
jgi:hypothetical protein